MTLKICPAPYLDSAISLPLGKTGMDKLYKTLYLTIRQSRTFKLYPKK